MAALTLLIHDDRYKVPTLDIVEADNDAVRALAIDRLLESSHHTAVDVYEDDCLRISVTAPESDARTSPHSRSRSERDFPGKGRSAAWTRAATVRAAAR
jgi:hypothetical protein